MSDLRVGNGHYFFDRGIDLITYQGGEATQGLPDPRELTPSEQAGRPQLEQLLALPNMETFLEEALRPHLDDPDLMLPGKFRQALESARDSLRQMADTMATQSPDQAKLLGRAARLLSDETGLRDLLQMYRSVLYQG